MEGFKFFVEDRYGVEFFGRLITRLKKEKLIPDDVYIDSDKLPADCNTKLERELRSALIFSNKFKRAVLVFDGDGYPDKKRRVAETHIPKEFRSRVDVISSNTRLRNGYVNLSE
jgi:hypothetical protein